jgi:3-oxoacyl-[acyl-carrier-protein] synthase-3
MIKCISSYLPPGRLTNEQLAREFGDWTAKKIYEKTGIKERRVAPPDVCASDLAFAAASQVLDAADRSRIDFLLLCTQAPDYWLPSTACLLQHRLGLPTSCGALDYNLGCSGFIYGLAMGQALLQGGLASNLLLLTADTYTHYIHRGDRSTRTLFGDGAAATILSKDALARLHSFVFGTDGSGAEQLIVRAGGARMPVARCSGQVGAPAMQQSVAGSDANLFMNGPEIFNFTIQRVPALVLEVCKKAGLSLEQVDYFVFHQANAFMLEHLRKHLRIPCEKFEFCLEHCGNTVSSTIPIALECAIHANRIKPGMKVLLAGFGVGLSWGGCILEWNN